MTAAYAVTIEGKLYAMGETTLAAQRAFDHQISGATSAMKSRMWMRSVLVELDADAASEAAECLDAPWN